MSREVTHRFDRAWGRVVQIVSAERLRAVLDADGDSYDRPEGFGPDDEWDVAAHDDDAACVAEVRAEQDADLRRMLGDD